jgi:hypothetical protein
MNSIYEILQVHQIRDRNSQGRMGLFPIFNFSKVSCLISAPQSYSQSGSVIIFFEDLKIEIDEGQTFAPN